MSWGSSADSPIGAALDQLGFGFDAPFKPYGNDPTKGIGFGSSSYGNDPTKGIGITELTRGVDPLMDQALPEYQAYLDKQEQALAAKTGTTAGTASGAGFNQGWNATPGGGGNAAAVGGQWANFDTATDAINAAATKYGVPANLIKAMINNESSGDWERDGNRPTYIDAWQDTILPYVGIYSKTAQAWGYDFNQLVGNQGLQIDAMANGLKRLYDQSGSWDGAITTYFSGHAVPNGWSDGSMTDYEYLSKTKNNWNGLEQMSGSTRGATPPGMSSGGVSPSQVVDVAVGYANQNLPYVLGSVPGKGVTPTSWDCSGMTYWLDQNYGSGNLPMGSHEQYSWAQNNGLFTDYSQLRPGDLIFFNTGASYRGNAASHVVMYIGNGKVVHAANPQAGTIISDFASYQGMYPTMGAVHMPWSGGGGYSGSGAQQQSAPAQSAQPLSMNQLFSALLAGRSVPGYGR